MELWGYVRKSTESEERQVQSIQAQKDWIINYCEVNSHTLLGIIEESKSAKQPGREEYAKLMGKFTKPKEQGIICWQLNRLARNPIDEGTIKWLVQQGIVKNIFTVDGISDGSNILLMSVHFGMATQYIIDLSKNVKRGLKQKVESGGIIAQAPIGYHNDKNTNTAKLDKSKSHYIERIFELKIEGKTLSQIQKIITKEGMRTNKGQEVSKQSLHYIIKNPFYYGMIQYLQEFYEGKHTPIIPKAIWERANSITRGIEYRKHENLTPLKGKVYLMEIKGTKIKTEFEKYDGIESKVKLTTSLKKGKYIYFHLSGKYGKQYGNICIAQKRIIEVFDKRIADGIYTLPSIEKETLVQEIYKYHNEKINNNKEIRNRLNQEIKKLESRKERLIQMRLDCEITSEEFCEDKNKITKNIFEIREELTRIEMKNENILSQLNDSVETLVSLPSKRKTYSDEKKLNTINHICVELFVDKKKSLYIEENSFFRNLRIINSKKWLPRLDSNQRPNG